MRSARNELTLAFIIFVCLSTTLLSQSSSSSSSSSESVKSLKQIVSCIFYVIDNDGFGFITFLGPFLCLYLHVSRLSFGRFLGSSVKIVNLLVFRYLHCICGFSGLLFIKMFINCLFRRNHDIFVGWNFITMLTFNAELNLILTIDKKF